MAFLLRKFQEAAKTIAKSKVFARDPRQLQFEADINRLFLYTSYNCLGKGAGEADAEEIIDMASKAPVAEQQKQVQENIHTQIEAFCKAMDDILLPAKKVIQPHDTPQQSSPGQRRSGLTFAVGGHGPYNDGPTIPETRSITRAELSQRLKDSSTGFKLDLRPSKIPHKEAGTGLFLDGAAEVGSVVAFYPGVIYSPAYYRHIPGYPRVDAQNPYLISRYDGTVINAQPWGCGGETREKWEGLTSLPVEMEARGGEQGGDRLWKLLSKPLDSTRTDISSDVLERRNPLAFAHFANHPAKGMEPNVMICPYDFPLTEREMRAYIPNVSFRNAEVNMWKFGSFWFRSGRSKSTVSDVPVLKALVLVATKALCDEEVLLNYRLSNSKRRPAWYTPVDEEEERRRWG